MKKDRKQRRKVEPYKMVAIHICIAKIPQNSCCIYV